MKITVLGDGGWGTALALLLHGYGHATTLWGAFPAYLEEIRRAGENVKFLPGVPIPGTLRLEGDPAAAVRGAELVVVAAPSKFYRSVCERFAGALPSGVPLASVTKGLCEGPRHRMSEIAREVLGPRRVAVLSGPSHAEEVARRIPTAVVCASDDEGTAALVQEVFNGPRFRVYASDDPVGVELGGAVKNVVAVAVGASDGLGFGDNTRAALVTRGVAEMARLGVAMGARPETFAGLSGLGDLVVTCTSRHSRNRSVGERLARGERLPDILSGMAMVAEGVDNCRVVCGLAARFGVEMPISEAVRGVCFDGLPAQDAVETLMGRSLKPETWGA
ncbi:MAG: NAD(P)H-dependent glycerol-3-phosphate dehydrogenase [Kiritimatiellia bacterium]|jgi:glycerol-3-phosphate dehydrogenase (NAD(P)+)